MDEFLSQIWGAQKLFLDMRKTIVADEKNLAVMLAANPQNLDRFMALGVFRDMLHSLNLRADIFSVQIAQVGALNALAGHKISKSKLLGALEILFNERIITEAEFSNLTQFLSRFDSERLNLSDEAGEVRRDFFHDGLARLNLIYEKLSEINSDEALQNRLDNQKQKSDELKFSVAVTGVINAGKSTLLNALLNKKILGASNVPETANLTLLKQGENARAKVKFWSGDELARLGLGQNLAKFAGSEIWVGIDELSDYTSAKNEISAAVKSVELYDDCELLRDGICIVDTPGIDDAVFLREQLVREYMSECDLMVHLMNAAQAATQKDVDFILDSLRRSHIARLVVAITHADMLGERELNESATYAQKSLKERLSAEGFGKIADEMRIFRLSAKKYFTDAQNSGVNEFKSYLYDTFFSEDNDKSRLALAAYENELKGVASELLARFKQNLLNLSGSNLELKQRLEALGAQKLALQNELNAVQEAVAQELAKIDESVIAAEFALNIKRLKSVVKDRILNEINFAKKQGGAASDKRVRYIAQSALNDGILGAARDSRNEILRQTSAAAQNLRLKFSDFAIDTQSGIVNIGEQASALGVSFAYAGLLEGVSASLKSAPKELESALDAALEAFLADENIANFAFKLVQFEKDKFSRQAVETSRLKQEKFSRDEAETAAQIEILSGAGEQTAQELESLGRKIARLEEVLKEIADV